MPAPAAVVYPTQVVTNYHDYFHNKILFQYLMFDIFLFLFYHIFHIRT